MNRTKFFLFSIVVLLLVTAATSTTKAQSTAIVTENNNCLIPDGNRVVRVFKCSDGGIRYTITNGYIKTADNYCFDHGIPRYTTSGDRSVKLVPCRQGNMSQVWYIIENGTSTGVIQNAVNPDVCLNIESAADRPGSRVIVWPCGFGHPAANERFYVGGAASPGQLGSLPKAARDAVNAGGSVTFYNGAHIVAAGAGNIVAAGAGNIVAAGAGNIVAAGAGNLTGAGTLLSPNGSNIANSIIAASSGVGFQVH